ncbi:short-chain collagen C4-like [Amphiura filiformis]|uniref:short-chain collagen C4-like n=1 Tax=Amphiura filiformis TaxID=82378 RepID=UPI003B21B510
MDKLIKILIVNIVITACLISRISGEALNLQCTSEPYVPVGTTYIRYGRTVCPDTADLVYSGVLAGAKGAGIQSAPESGYGNEEPGGGSNYLCLTNTPQFDQSVPGQQDSRARLYAAEYRSGEAGALQQYHTYDAPCAVCQSREGRTQSFMMPATVQCPTGWTTEYNGYLAAARWNHPRTQHVCLDRNPEIISGTKSVNPRSAISYLFQVEVGSDSGLPPAYETGDDLTCAICTM